MFGGATIALSIALALSTNGAIRYMLIYDQYEADWEDGGDLQVPVVLLGIHLQQNDGL